MNYIDYILFQELLHFSLHEFLDKKLEYFQIQSIPSALYVKILMNIIKSLQKI